MHLHRWGFLSGYKQAAKKRKEEKRLQEEQRRQELALKKQECETKGDLWNGKDCRKKSVTPVIPIEGKWSEYQGEMNWSNAKAKCVSFGMRLPTREELVAAHKEGVWEKWQKEVTHLYPEYLTSEESSPERVYSVDMKDGYVSGYFHQDYNIGNVRCVR